MLPVVVTVALIGVVAEACILFSLRKTWATTALVNAIAGLPLLATLREALQPEPQTAWMLAGMTAALVGHGYSLYWIYRAHG